MAQDAGGAIGELDRAGHFDHARELLHPLGGNPHGEDHAPSIRVDPRGYSSG